MTTTRWWTAGMLMLVAATPSSSQQQRLSWPPPEGSKIRVVWIDKARSSLIGQFNETTRDTLRFTPDGARIPLSTELSALRSVEISAGTRSHTKQGALFGGLVTGLAFFGLAAASPGQDQGTGFAAGVGVVFGVLGAAVGALLGSLYHSDAWVPQTIPSATLHAGSSSGLESSEPRQLRR